MSFDATQKSPLAELREQLRGATVLTPELVSGVIAQACGQRAVSNSSVSANWFHRLIEAHAWTDAALALIDLQTRWKLRRFVHEGGAWSCMLCRRWTLPDWLDDTIEASHEVLALAILCAFVEARCADDPGKAVPRTVPRVESAACQAISCDNFA